MSSISKVLTKNSKRVSEGFINEAVKTKPTREAKESFKRPPIYNEVYKKRV